MTVAPVTTACFCGYMSIDANITKRKRRRVQRDGSVKQQYRYVVNWNDGGRNQRFFETRLEAQEFRAKLLINATPAKKSATTVGEIIKDWLTSKQRAVRGSTHTAYSYYAEKLEPLAETRIDKLTTKGIRDWYEAAAECGEVYSVNRALSMLKAVLERHAEDTGTRPVPMPHGLSRNAPKRAKRHLTTEQVRAVITDGEVYVAFPFLTGTRISEQLGLSWADVDFEAGLIHIRRTQDKGTGEIHERTKTEAGTRAIPMSATLRVMLAEWKLECPSKDRVFPAPQGGVLLYSNYLHRMWTPTLKRLKLPKVGVHSARASFISMLQATGVDVATAAKLAGHSNPAVTLSHYTHSLSDGREAVEGLDAALAG